MTTLRAWQRRRDVQGQFLPVYHLLQCTACGYCERSCAESRSRAGWKPRVTVPQSNVLKES